MEVTSTTPTLVKGEAVEAPSSLTVLVPLAEVEAALAAADPPELRLDVFQQTEGGLERHNVGVTWDRAALEQLAAEASSQGVTLTFDSAELGRIIDEGGDLELHGMREKALALTIAFAAASTGASAAFAGNDEIGLTERGITSAVVVTHDEAGLTERGIAPSVATAHDEASLAARGITPEVAAVNDEASLAARGITPSIAASHDEASLAARGITPEVAAVNDEASLAARGITPEVAAVNDEASLASRGIRLDTPTLHEEASLAARGITPEATVSASDASATGVSIDPSTAVLLGFVGGLAIAGAAFVARRQREVQPA